MVAMDILMFAGFAAVMTLMPDQISETTGNQLATECSCFLQCGRTCQANYEASSELCCNGRVHPRNATNLCCGSVTYDTQVFGCCSEKLYPLPIDGGRTYECCYPSPGVRYNSVPFNYRTHKCCQGHVTAMPNASEAGNYYCCGDQVYDFRTHLCCGEKVLEKHMGDDCCNGKVFNSSHQACCWGSGAKAVERRLLDIEGNRSSCCGFQLYDPARNTCCSDAVRPLPTAPPGGTAEQRLACCDEEPFYTPAQFCCETFESRNGTLVIASYEVHPGGDATTCCGDCCHSHLSHFKPHGTEYNVSASCCDNTIIHPDTHECRDGRVHAFNVTTVQHCGAAEYDSARQRCCGDEVLDMDSDYHCCYSNDKKYHKTRENCCGKDIVPISDSDRAANKISCCPRF